MRSRSSGGTPTPVSVTVTTSSSSARSARTSTLPPSGVNLTALDTRLSTHLLEPQLVGVDGVDVVVDLDGQRDAVAGRALAHQRERRTRARCVDAEHRRLEDHLAGLDLGQVEDLVEQLEEVRAGVPDVVDILVLALVELAEHPVEEDLREADDRVQRGAQLVGHAGQELRLVVAGHLQLGATSSPAPGTAGR